MILVGPTAATVTPRPAISPSLTVGGVVMDLVAHTMSIAYGQRTITVAIAANLLTSVEAAVQAAIETDQGWAPGSSVISTP